MAKGKGRKTRDGRRIAAQPVLAGRTEDFLKVFRMIRSKRGMRGG